MKRALVVVTNDLITDQRAHKTAVSLVRMGFEVFLLGREKRGSLPVSERPSDIRPYFTLRLKLPFEKGPLFYSWYNLELFFFILFALKNDLIVSNDLDTLPACFLGAKLRGSRLLYDSHEYFTEVPELIRRPVVRTLWRWIEKIFVNRLYMMMTVSEAIADEYRKKYPMTVEVIHNFPYLLKGYNRIKYLETGNRFVQEGAAGKTVILYQGVLNRGRGLEYAIDAMHYIEGGVLVLIGDGDIRARLEKQVSEKNLESRVKFFGKIPFETLHYYTVYANIGLLLEESSGMNYRYSLSNKLFDYIHAGVPLLASPLDEVKKIFTHFDMGMIIEKHDPLHIAEKMIAMAKDEAGIQRWKENMKRAAIIFCREGEEKKFEKIIHKLMEGKN